jgi:hypothetical protein
MLLSTFLIEFSLIVPIEHFELWKAYYVLPALLIAIGAITVSGNYL